MKLTTRMPLRYSATRFAPFLRVRTAFLKALSFPVMQPLGRCNRRSLKHDAVRFIPRTALSCLDDARRSRAIFGFVLIVGAVMSSAFCAEIGIPLALMLSADPLPRSDQRA